MRWLIDWIIEQQKKATMRRFLAYSGISRAEFDKLDQLEKMRLIRDYASR